MGTEVLEVSGFEYFLADGREDLGEEVLDVFFWDDLGERLHMEMFEEVDEFFKGGEGFVFQGDRVHISGCYLLVPFFFGDIFQGILYHIYLYDSEII